MVKGERRKQRKGRRCNIIWLDDGDEVVKRLYNDGGVILGLNDSAEGSEKQGDKVERL